MSLNNDGNDEKEEIITGRMQTRSKKTNNSSQSLHSTGEEEQADESETNSLTRSRGSNLHDSVGDIDDEDDNDEDSPPASARAKKGNEKKGRRKIKIEFIEDKSRRHITFSKRKAGIMKKAYELATLTGTQVLLLVASETGHVYTFATPKLQPLITKSDGKNLIQSCLNAPDQTQQQNQQQHSPPSPSSPPRQQQQSQQNNNNSNNHSREPSPREHLQNSRGGGDNSQQSQSPPQQLPTTTHHQLPTQLPVLNRYDNLNLPSYHNANVELLSMGIPHPNINQDNYSNQEEDKKNILPLNGLSRPNVNGVPQMPSSLPTYPSSSMYNMPNVNMGMATSPRQAFPPPGYPYYSQPAFGFPPPGVPQNYLLKQPHFPISGTNQQQNQQQQQVVQPNQSQFLPSGQAISSPPPEDINQQQHGGDPQQ